MEPIVTISKVSRTCSSRKKDCLGYVELSQANLGHRSPQSSHVLTSTVSKVRHRLRLLRSSSQSHPRNMAGSLTVSQVAGRLGVSVGWVYDRIHNGRIRVAKDAATKLYLFPGEPATMERLRELKEGNLQEIGF